MTTPTPEPQIPTPQSPTPQPPTQPAPTGQKPANKNTLGLVAMIMAIAGLVLACIPGIALLGWFLLPVSFILGIVSLFLKDKKKGQGIAAIIISVVGTIIAAIVFLGVIATSVDDAFTDETSVQTTQSEAADDGAAVAPEEDAAEEEPEPAEPQGDQGTRANPYPLGSTISTSDWEVTVNSVDLDATAAIVAESPINDAPDAEHTYILVNLTATYIGTDPEGATVFSLVEYVSPAGNTFSRTDRLVVAPDSFDSLQTLYEGASITGNIAIHVPSDDVENGVLGITPSMFGDKIFVAVE